MDRPRLYELRQLQFSELSDPAMAQLEARLTDGDRDRLARMQAESAAFLQGKNLGSESAAILARLEAAEAVDDSLGARIVRWFDWRGALGVAAAAAILLTIVPFSGFLGPERGPNRTKGSVALQMFVKDQGGIREGVDGMILHEGDQIQFRYRAPKQRFLMVVSVDSAGNLSPLYPDTPGSSVEIEPGPVRTLEGSVILDDTLGPERIYAIFSATPLHYDDVQAAWSQQSETDLTRLQKLGIERDDAEETSILIIKE